MHQLHLPPDGALDGIHHRLEALDLLLRVGRVGFVADRQVGEDALQVQAGTFILDIRCQRCCFLSSDADAPHAGIHFQVHVRPAFDPKAGFLQQLDVAALAYR